MNIVIIVGRISSDIEIKMTSNGKKVTTISVAVQRDKETADFITVRAWEKKAEFLERYFRKGKPVSVVGTLRIDEYTDKTGSKKKYVYVHATDVNFCITEKIDEPTAQTGNLCYNNSETSFDKVDQNEDLPF